MDTKWLATIVMAAVIAAVVKEFTSVIIQRMPRMVSTLRAMLAPVVVRILRKHWRIIIDLFGMASVVIGFRFLIPTLGTVTHGTVFIVGMFSAWFVYWQFELLRDIRRLTDAA